MSELFQEYRGLSEKDGVVAASKVEREKIRALSQITGGTEVWKKVRGGSMVLSEILLHGASAKVGDYIVAEHRNTFRVVKKDYFESKYEYKGLLRDPVV